MAYTNIDGIELGQFNEIIIELGHYDDGVYHMSDFDEIVTVDGWEAIRGAFYGGRYGLPSEPFNPNDEFFSFNGYGNLISISTFSLQDYFNEFESEILEYVNTNEIELYGVEEDGDGEE